MLKARAARKSEKLKSESFKMEPSAVRVRSNFRRNKSIRPGLWVMSFIYKYIMSSGFTKGVSGRCFVLINK